MICSRHEIADKFLTWREATTIQSVSTAHTYVYVRNAESTVQENDS